jgi:hypothetical protein
MNVNRTHTSSGVYFQIKESGICQRCYCKKDSTVGRLNGPCNKYASKEIPLTKTLQTLLFGLSSINKKKKEIVSYFLPFKS